MRKDALGFFWRDEPVVKEAKEVHKVVPPKPVWLYPTYLPYLDRALEFAANAPTDGRCYTDSELLELAHRKESGERIELVCDTEVYSNYFCAAFKNPESGKCIYVEQFNDGWANPEADLLKLDWLLKTFTIVTFNGNSYDLPILAVALAARTTQEIKSVSDQIILEGKSPWEVLRPFKAKKLQIDHVDLIEVAPLRGSLKTYSGRIHCQRMQDLPFAPDVALSDKQRAVVLYYCVNDLDNTIAMLTTLREHVSLREQVGKLYGIDLRSRSDAQVAEDVFNVEVSAMNRERCQKTTVAPGTIYHYRVPSFMEFQTDLLNWAFNMIRFTPFVVAFHGSFDKPKALDRLQFEINGTTYKMGNGGLHSCEHQVAHVTDDEFELHDFDVTSYYPRVIINQKLFPKHLGPNFLIAFNRKVEERIVAKRAKDMVKANGFKIVVNGGFGKLGNKHSIMYSPDLLLQVTLTGQLSLLMLIEQLELSDIHVVSANTDGIVVKCRRSQHDQMIKIIEWWQERTGFELEETRYMGIYSRDVNSYIAVKQTFDDATKQWIRKPASCKTKGAYANPWKDSKDKSMWMHKNPQRTICIDAIEKFLVDGTPVETTILACRDLRKFLSVQNVTGGAVKVWNEDDIQYLGKTVRWYYAVGVTEPLIYAKTGKKVPRSDGAQPCMELPDQFPQDLNFDWYIAEANQILHDIGYYSES